MYCDLHTHSCCSDGTFSPTEIIDAAEKLGLGAVALCDHNTVSGLQEFTEAAKGRKIAAVPGVEFSAEYKNSEIHILALFVGEKYYATVHKLMEESRLRKERSNADMVDALCKDGFKIDIEEIKRLNPNAYINRAHIAAVLTEKGYTDSIKAAFDELLKPNGKYYVPPKRVDAFEIIKFIRSIRAVPVLAHPFLNLSEAELDIFLKAAKETGLCGMETKYTLFTMEESRKAAGLAEKHGLLKSGGSDFHGETKPNTALGAGRGELRVPMSFFEDLKRCAEALK